MLSDGSIALEKSEPELGASLTRGFGVTRYVLSYISNLLLSFRSNVSFADLAMVIGEISWQRFKRGVPRSAKD